MVESRGKLPFEERKAEVLVKSESVPGNSGRLPSERNTKELLEYGIVVVDKPSGPTSHQVADYVKRILKVSKAGHSGTLDPGVTGVLPVALQDATRITNSLLTAGKEYVCLMHLHGDVSEEKLAKVLDEFRGKIRQLPPKKSAVKRVVRERSIYYLEVIERNEREVLFRTGTQAGTYIRKLVHDIGARLGCGAHMVELRRTKAGPFDESLVVTLQDLADAYHYYTKEGDDSRIRKIVLPMEAAVSHLKKIWVHDSTVDSLCHGAFLKVPGVCKLDSDIERADPVAVLTLKGELVLVGEAQMDSMDIKNMSRGIAVKTSQVFMKPGVY